MPAPLVECVPNFSEARRPEVVDSIREAIGAVPNVRILDQHSDLDHNRTVITFAGSPEAVEEAAFRGIARAAELINLDQHHGEHPRIGATDVVPFIPLSGVSMEACVEIARRLGRRVGEELQIPVYLYEQAATRPERQNLENIRRGQYEALKSEIGERPEREPDFGPARVGPAGATVIGARPFLIAFNVYLTTDDVAIAKEIARAIRHSSGGLRFVKALGLLVEGRAQISMNLTDFHRTPVARVVELIRREAARYGIAVHHSELVGLIPQDAIIDTAVWYLQLDQFEPEQVMEKRLFSALQESLEPAAEPSVASQPEWEAGFGRGFLEALAAGSPTPGGGSAAAAAGAGGAALVSMVARLTTGKKKYAEVEAQMQAIAARADSLRAELTAAVKADAEAFEAVMAAFRLPQETENESAERAGAIERATLAAARVPLQVAGKAVEVLELAAQVVSSGNLNAISDGATGAALAQAALTGAGLNVRINAASLKDKSKALSLLTEVRALEEIARSLQDKLRAEVSERGGISLE
jgi:glutamate formiminotransferase / formiminotetrahydrofolate cyclodeaminase